MPSHVIQMCIYEYIKCSKYASLLKTKYILLYQRIVSFANVWTRRIRICKLKQFGCQSNLFILCTLHSPLLFSSQLNLALSFGWISSQPNFRKIVR